VGPRGRLIAYLGVDVVSVSMQSRRQLQAAAAAGPSDTDAITPPNAMICRQAPEGTPAPVTTRDLPTLLLREVQADHRHSTPHGHRSIMHSFLHTMWRIWWAPLTSS
jgi:hypothetical protein